MTEGQVFHYTGSARVFGWYDLQEHDQFICPCGWTGVFREMSNGFFDELIDGSCPNCDTMLSIRSLPTLDEIRAAAAVGIPEAVAELRSIEEHSAGEEHRPDAPLSQPQQSDT